MGEHAQTALLQRRKQSPGRWKMSAPWCSRDSTMTYRREYKQILFSTSFLLNPVCINFFFIVSPFYQRYFTSLIVQSDAQETHSFISDNYSDGSSNENVTDWCCVAAPQHQANTGTLSSNCCSIFSPLQMMKRTKLQINKINIVSAACVHRFSTPLHHY